MDEQIKVAPRSFNRIEIDEVRGILTKTSRHKEKFIDEIRWYLKIPKQLRCFAPRIFDYSLDGNAPFVKMEFYAYRTLHEMFLTDSLWGGGYCKKIFQRLLTVVEAFQACRIECTKTDAQAAVKAMYVDKTLRRLATLRHDENFKDFFERKIVVNGKIFHSLNEILALLPVAVERLLFENAEKYFSVIHGDLCLPNILVAAEHNFLRLVDPRGEFGDFDIYGDWRYDLAKLLHSVEGNYDLIIADKFTANARDFAIDYEMPQDFSEVREIFFEVFKSQLNNLLALRLIEATLFLSMVPLHANSLSRQRIMLATGVELFESVVKDFSGGAK